MSLFTVEQLELIRRLRSTGISGEAVLEAFRTLEKIESDLDATRAQSAALAALIAPSRLLSTHGSSTSSDDHGATSDLDLPEQQLGHQSAAAPPHIPHSVAGIASSLLASTSNPLLLQRLTSQAFQSSLSSAGLLRSPAAVPENVTRTTPPNDGRHSVAGLPSALLSNSHLPNSCLLLPGSLAGGIHFPGPLAVPSTGSMTNLTTFGSTASRTGPIRSSQSTQSSPPSITAASSNRPIRSQRTPMKEITTLDDPSELDDFLAQGEEACIADMKAFITQFSLRQTTVAMMTGVSQPYISKLLNGNHRELSLRCRKNIYCWYLNCRRHPEKLASFLQDPMARLETTPDGELVPQRRERYVFRPVLIKILEAYFREAPFPDSAKRAEIAAACNRALQAEKKGTQLMPKEVVTPQVIANWFANKRKEMRRRSNEGDSNTPNTGAGENVMNFSECGSTPSPLTNSNGATPLMDTLMDVAADGEQRSAAEDFLNARPFIHMQQQFANANAVSANRPETNPITTMASSLMSLLNLPVHSSSADGTSTGVSPSSTDSLSSMPTSCTGSSSQDLMQSLTQNGVLSFINSFYPNGMNQQKLKTVAE